MTARDLVDAGDAGRAVAQGVRDVDVGDPVRALAAALPGGAVARSAAGVERSWTAALTALADRTARHAEAMTASATAYTEAEGAVLRALSGVG